MVTHILLQMTHRRVAETSKKSFPFSLESRDHRKGKLCSHCKHFLRLLTDTSEQRTSGEGLDIHKNQLQVARAS